MRSVAVLALALGVFTLDAGSSTPVSAEEPGSATLTSQLLPGWNMVAWLGPEAPVSELFDAIPALRQVSAWDSEEQRYRQALRTSTPRDGLTRLTAGMGLWLRVGGDEAVEWTRPLSEGHVLLSLRSGLNLVGWTGRDGESFAQSAGRVADALVLASRWNAETQSYELFGPPAKDSLRLNRGEAIWVELNDDARWWQWASFDGRTEPTLTFLGDVPDETEAAIGREFQVLQSFFRERFGDWPGDYRVDVAADWESAAPQYSRPSQESSACVHPFWPSKLLVVLPCPQPLPDYVARFHFQNVRERLAPGSASSPFRDDGTPYHGPRWLNLGAERYVEYAYLRFADPESADQHRAWNEADAAQTAEPLSSFETRIGHTGMSGPGFLAAEWLALRAGHSALFEYYALLRFVPHWRDAFEMAFGLTVEQFYEAFALYRSESALLLPHLTDDRDEPVLVLLGDIAPEAEATVRAQFEAAQEFFRERLGAPPADYTVYVTADDESAAAPFRRAFGRDPDPGFCHTSSSGVAAVMTLDCGRSLAHYLGEYHFREVREQLLSGEWTGPPRSHGPKWLRVGAVRWAEYTFLAASGAEPLDRIRAGLVRQAARTAEPLSTVLGSAGADLPYEVEEALGFFAVEQLVARTGEKAVLDYYRLLLTSEDWEAAFEGAFGITVDAFYEAFEDPRSALDGLASAPGR